MQTVLTTILAVIALVAGMNTFGRAAINEHTASVAAAEQAQRKVDRHAQLVADCAAGRTNVIMVGGKFCR